MTVFVGCDVGGTFTDLIMLDENKNIVRVAKVPTTVDNQAFGVMRALAAADADLAGVDGLIHGTTTTTNALLEKKVSLTGLITTKGFRDILELGRRTRPNPYGMTGTFTPLIARQHRLEVPERLDAEGRILEPLDESAVAAAAQALAAAGCESLVIHFLHAYVNPVHEQRAAEIARAHWPNSHITCGSDILAEFREYERGTAAAVNAAIQPVLKRYIGRLENELQQGGYQRELLVMQGNGGTVTADVVTDAAINTVMSGPASGVIAAAYTGRLSGFEQLITYDMGGTSCDVGLIEAGVPKTSADLQLEYGMPIHVPMVDVHAIGAGGGSIAWINDGGLLEVGPQSAGADPGPICYGRGGTAPTITDANLLLGRLNPERLLAVDGHAPRDAVATAMVREIGDRLGLTAEATAAAIVQIGNNRMAGAVRMVSLSRGYDPRDFALFAFGGAGPLHATALARELAIPKVLVPARPGITNAIGCLTADIRHDFVKTVNKPMEGVDIKQVHGILDEQIATGKARIEAAGVAIDGMSYLHAADMQFQGQSHILEVPITDIRVSQETLQADFEAAYYARFQLRLPEIRAVLVGLRTAVIGRRRDVALGQLMDSSQRKQTLPEAKVAERQVWFEGRGGNSQWLTTPIYARDALPLGAEFDGPAILEQLDTTIVIEPTNHVLVDPFGNLVIDVVAEFRDV